MRFPANPDEAQQIVRLRRFLRPLRVVLFSFGAALLVGGVILGSGKHTTVGLVVLAYFMVIHAAQRFVDERRLVVGAALVAYGALVVVLVAGLLFPFSAATSAISGLVAVAIALPYLEGPRLRLFLLASYAVVVAIVARGFHSDPEAKLPVWVEFPAVVGGGAAAAYLLLFLLWQFTDRLRQTLDRTRRAHEQAEAARRNADFLAEASRRLGDSSLDYLATLRTAAELTVPKLADFCMIDELVNNDHLRKVAAVHVEPKQQGLLDRLHELYSSNVDHPALEAVRTSKPILEPEIDDARLERTASSREHAILLFRLRPRSAIVVPLLARGRPLGSMILARTNSNRRFGEHDLALVLELAYRVALTADNARLYAEARTAVQARDEFLSIASHELKTPLTPLELQIQTVRRHLPEIVKGTVSAAWLEQRLNVISRQSERLARLVDELLDISRIVAGKFRLELEPVDLTELVRDMSDRFQWTGGTTQSLVRLNLDVADGVVGRWDRLRVEQVLTNLMSNAVKYGSGRPIEVAMRSDGTTATLAVIDRGIGIAPADQRRIFDRFERASSASHFGGLGLGLFITRQIVEALGGTIRVDSELGKGSTFTVELPLSGPPEVHVGSGRPMTH